MRTAKPHTISITNKLKKPQKIMKKRNKVVMGICIILLFLFTLKNRANAQHVPVGHVPNELIIVTSEPLLWDVCEQEIHELVLPIGAKVIGCADRNLQKQNPEMTHVGYIKGTQFLVKLSAATELLELQSGNIMRNNPIITNMYLNVIGQQTSSLPLSQNDPNFATSQYHLKYDLTAIANGVKYQGWSHAYGYKFIDTAKIVVAIQDGGLNFAHQDVVNSYRIKANEPINNQDDDNNGYVDDYRGWDAVNGDNDPTDDNVGPYHGTQMFGIGAAAINNGMNICGQITDTGTTLVVKVINSNGVVSDFSAATGYNYALGEGADVNNMSYVFTSNPSLLMSAIALGVSNYNSVPVAGVGNTGGLYYGFPASGPNVITVGNANSGGVLNSGSSYSDSVDVLGRGVSVVTLSGANNTGSAIGTGSSPATVNISGYIWWIRKTYPNLTVPQVTNVIRGMGINGGFQSNVGWGYVVGLDTFLYEAMRPDTLITLNKCTGNQPLPVTHHFQIVDSSRYGNGAIVGHSWNTNIAPVGTSTYSMAWKSEPRPNEFYRDTFHNLKVVMVGSGWTVASTTLTTATTSPCGSFTLNVGGNTGAALKTLYRNGVAIVTGSNATSFVESGLSAGTYNYFVVSDLASTGTCWDKPFDTSAVLTVNVGTATAIPTISITANPSGAICAGSSVTFTASITDGGTAPSYQWKVNGSNVGSNLATYTYNPVNGDQVSCVLTSNASCVVTNTATSNIITETVNPVLTPTINVTANPSGAICTGTSVTFTAAITNGGVNPIFQWKKNGANVGTNSSTYTATSLVNGDIITCDLTSNATCVSPATVTSAGVTMTVNPQVTPSVSITSSASAICAGASVAFTANPVNGGSNPIYQWKKNGVNVGVNSITYFDVTLTSTDVITCELTSSASCASPATVTSNGITTAVTTPSVPSVTVGASAASVCTGTPVTFTATPVNGGSAPTYQWKKNAVNVGTNSATYVDAGLVSTDVITVEMTTSLICVTAASATSTGVSVIVNSMVTPSVSVTSTSTSFCAHGGAATLTANSNVSGASYQWYDGVTPVGTNSNTYLSSGVPSGAHNYSVVITVPAGGCFTSTTATSNIVSINVDPALTLTAPTTTGVPVYLQSNNYDNSLTVNIPSGVSTYILHWYEYVLGVPTLVHTSTNIPTWVKQLTVGYADSIFVWLLPTSGCWSADSIQSNISIVQHPNAIAGPSMTEFNLYPNPVNRSFTVKGVSSGDIMKITNPLGQVIMNHVFKDFNGSEQIEFHFAAGVYIAVFYDKENRPYKSVRLIKSE